jgi:hypothetical protein
LADLQPHRFDTGIAVGPRLVFDDLQHAFGDRHLMHGEPLYGIAP